MKLYPLLLALFFLFLLPRCSFINSWINSPSADLMKKDTQEVNNDTLKANAMAEVLNFKMNCFEIKAGDPSECLKFDGLTEKCKTNDFSACEELLRKFSP